MRDFTFLWYRPNGDGSAAAFPDTPATRARVDAAPNEWYGSPEGVILYAGVIATAFKRKTEATYDGPRYFATGEMLQTGTVTHTTITAERSE